MWCRARFKFALRASLCGNPAIRLSCQNHLVSKCLKHVTTRSKTYQTVSFVWCQIQLILCQSQVSVQILSMEIMCCSNPTAWWSDAVWKLNSESRFTQTQWFHGLMCSHGQFVLSLSKLRSHGQLFLFFGIVSWIKGFWKESDAVNLSHWHEFAFKTLSVSNYMPLVLAQADEPASCAQGLQDQNQTARSCGKGNEEASCSKGQESEETQTAALCLHHCIMNWMVIGPWSVFALSLSLSTCQCSVCLRLPAWPAPETVPDAMFFSCTRFHMLNTWVLCQWNLLFEWLLRTPQALGVFPSRTVWCACGRWWTQSTAGIYPKRYLLLLFWDWMRQTRLGIHRSCQCWNVWHPAECCFPCLCLGLNYLHSVTIKVKVSCMNIRIISFLTFQGGNWHRLPEMLGELVLRRLHFWWHHGVDHQLSAFWPAFEPFGDPVQQDSEVFAAWSTVPSVICQEGCQFYRCLRGTVSAFLQDTCLISFFRLMQSNNVQIGRWH